MRVLQVARRQVLEDRDRMVLTFYVCQDFVHTRTVTGRWTASDREGRIQRQGTFPLFLLMMMHHREAVRCFRLHQHLLRQT